MPYKVNYYVFIILLFIALTSCSKEWLEEKPNQSLFVPSTLNDLNSLLLNSDLLNSNQPSYGEAGADDYYLNSAEYETLSPADRNIYSWAKTDNFYSDVSSANYFEWDVPYKAIFSINVVLEAVNKIKPENEEVDYWRQVKGGGHFFRAIHYFNLAQLYCKTFSPKSAASDKGLIIRKEKDINLPSKRSSVKETYEFILDDLLLAKDHLPQKARLKTQPSKAACFAMLARVYLIMSNFEESKRNADSCLALESKLFDYNEISDPATEAPFPLFNEEIIFYSFMVGSALLPISNEIGSIDSTLLKLYHDNDLRKSVYFIQRDDRITFKGSYGGDIYNVFNGLATDELYLIRAENNARLGNIDACEEDVNALLSKRYKSSTYETKSFNTKEEALSFVLQERRKELCFRGIRWTDLRRLNLESNLAKPIYRKIFDAEVVLPPNDDRYVYPIPDNELNLSGIEQNPR